MSLTSPSGKIASKKVIVVGMGPAGLAAAIEASKRGYEVTIYDNRDYFTRSQRVGLLEPGQNYLQSLISTPEDKQFWELYKAENTVPINVFQNFMYGKLKSYKIKICAGPQYEIQGFDLSKGTNCLIVKHKDKVESIEFDYFVAADGAKRTMVMKLNEALERTSMDKSIQHQELDIQLRQVPHFAICFKSKESLIRLSSLPKILSTLSRLKKFGWDQPFLPKLISFEDLQGKHFYMAGELPQNILELRGQLQSQQLIAWGKACLPLVFEAKHIDELISLDVIEIPEKIDPEQRQALEKENLLKATAFEVQLKYTDRPCVELNQGGYFTSIGDSTMNPNFFMGHGVSDALLDAVIFGKCLPTLDTEETFDSKTFIATKKGRQEIFKKRMVSIREGEKNAYKILIPEIQIKLRKYALELIELSKAYAKIDNTILAKSKELEKLIEGSDIDEIYQIMMELAEAVDKITDSKEFEEHLQRQIQSKREDQNTLREHMETLQNNFISNLRSTAAPLIYYLSVRAGSWEQERRMIAEEEAQLTALPEKVPEHRKKAKKIILKAPELTKHAQKLKQLVDEPLVKSVKKPPKSSKSPGTLKPPKKKK